MPSPFRVTLTLVVALAVTAGAVAAGVALSSPASPDRPTSRRSAPSLASMDTTTVGVRRAAFCDSVAAGEVHAAVGDQAPTAAAWSNGDLLPGTRDVAHEFGCSWTAAAGPVAAGWTFAPPVTEQRAQELIASARAERGCRPLPRAAAYGAPSLALTCTTGGTTTLSYRGLFGDAWLVCELTGSPATSRRATADRWCASVLQAAAAS